MLRRPPDQRLDILQQAAMGVGIRPAAAMNESVMLGMLILRQISPAGLEIWVLMVAGVTPTRENVKSAPTMALLLALVLALVALALLVLVLVVLDARGNILLTNRTGGVVHMAAPELRIL